MDDKWFKQQQKKAGITAEDIARIAGRDRSVVSRIYTGRQRMSLDWAKIFAEALGVPISEILERAGVASVAEAQQVSPMYAESDAFVWRANEASDRRVTTIADALGARSGVDIWRVRTGAMALAGYLPGDFVLVDTFQAERAKSGDVVVANVHTPKGPVHVLRRYLSPVLVGSASPTDEQVVHVVDGVNVVVRGCVTASWRS